MLREHETEIRVRYPEVDPMGFLHHANYIPYFEIGRTELLRASGGNYRKMEQSSLFMVVVSLDCRYLSPAHYDDLLRIRTTVKRMTSVRIEHEYQVFRDDVRLAVGHVTLAVVDRDGQICRVPQWMKDDH